MSSFPISRYLVPSPPMSEPPGFTVVDQALTAGLPATLPLTPELTLVIGIATGLAQTWRDADPQDLVATSAQDWLAFPGGAGAEPPASDPMRAELRLILIRSGSIVAAAPAIAGRRLLLPAGGDPELGTLIGIAVTAWAIYAGTVVGPGDFGSRIRFGWCLANVAVDSFMTPPISPNIISRLKDKSQTQSVLGSGVKRTPAGYGPPFDYVLVPEDLTPIWAWLELEYLPNVFEATGVPSNWAIF
jgi:hypothetical protein